MRGYARKKSKKRKRKQTRITSKTSKTSKTNKTSKTSKTSEKSKISKPDNIIKKIKFQYLNQTKIKFENSKTVTKRFLPFQI